jgi:hypothetical protein
MPQRCGQCGSSLKPGFLRDLNHHRAESIHWVEGPVVRSLFFGVKLRGRVRGEVHVLRCDACGRLEMFVPETTS